MAQNEIVETTNDSTLTSDVALNTDDELKAETTTVYSGKSTSSLDIIVDNDEHTISGNVIWDDFIGESYSKAYPGELGARNYNLICELTQKVNNELDSAASLKQQLVQRVTALENAPNNQSLSKQLSHEVARALNAEKKLSTALSTVGAKVDKVQSEFNTELQQVDSALSDRITNIETKLVESTSNDITRLKSRLVQLESNVSSEIVRSVSYDNQLLDSLGSVADSIVEAEQRLLATLDSEKASRASADAELQELIDTLRGATKKDIQVVENRIADEVKRAKEAEFILKLSIEDVMRHVDLIENASQPEPTSDVDLADIYDRLDSHEKRLKLLSSQLNKLASSQESLAIEFDDLVTTLNAQLYRTNVNVANNKARILKNFDSINELKRLTNSTIAALAKEVDERSEAVVEIQNILTSEIKRSTEEDEKHSKRLDEIVLQIIRHEVRTAEALGKINQQCKQSAEEIDDIKDVIQAITVDIEDSIDKVLSEHNYVVAIPNEGDQVEAYIQEGDNVKTKVVTTLAEPDTIVCRTETGEVTLPQLEEYDDSSAIPAGVVKQLIEANHQKIIEEINSILTFDVISGGNASL